MSKLTPKTIQIFLPGGDPQGIRVAEMTTRIVQVIEVPRSLIGEFLKMPESGQVALYFLFGQTPDDDHAVYIGQTGDLVARLTDHNRKKEFWEKALVVISRTNSLTQTHAVYLEWLSIKTSRETSRYPDVNGNAGTEPYTPAPMQADCNEIFDTAGTLLSTLGYPVFEPVAKTSPTEDPWGLFYCTRPGTNGQGQYTSEGFVVLKGSVGNVEIAPSMLDSAVERKREELLKSGTYRIEGDQVILEKDYLFNSPSMAAAFLVGKSCNGWLNWKDKAGRTLDELERQGTVSDSTNTEST